MKIQGAIFKNNKKEKETQPDYRGDGKTPDGAEYWFSGWIKTDKNGHSYLSLAIESKQEQATPEAPASAPANDSSLPF